MRKVLIALAALLVLSTGASVAAAWRYDEARSDRLAEGIEIAGVDVGGMRFAAARATLEHRVVAPLEQPIAVRYRHGQFVFSPADAEVRANLDTLLAKALADSRGGNFLTRTFRYLTSARLGARLSLDVSYSARAVQRFVRSVKRTVDRRARKAKSSASFVGIHISSSRNGVAVKEDALALGIESVLTDPKAPRSFDLPTRIVRPKVTTRELQRRFRYFIAVSRSKKELRFFVKQKLAKTYRVAIGRIGFETPKGLYEIKNKAVNPAWFVPNKPWAGDLAGKVIPPNDPENPIKARWMGFWDGAGIHGPASSASIGSAASHGCIRMTVPDVVQLYDRVPLRTPVYIS